MSSREEDSEGSSDSGPVREKYTLNIPRDVNCQLQRSCAFQEKIKAHHTFKENDKKKDFAAWDTYSYSKSAAASVN